LTYVRCHDDIGWNVLKPEVESLGDAQHHRLLQASHFFAGLTPNSYAQGASFQTTDLKTAHGTNGMASALVGMSSASNADELHTAVDRLILLQSLSFFTGGLPLLYMGDELGLGNTSAEILLARQGPDGRELHRPVWQEAHAQLRNQEGTVQHRIFSTLQSLAQLRQQLDAFHNDTPVTLKKTELATVLGLQRGRDLTGLFNFSRQAVTQELAPGQTIALKPFGFVWLQTNADKTLRILID
jgi:amylosucrase